MLFVIRQNREVQRKSWRILRGDNPLLYDKLVAKKSARIFSVSSVPATPNKTKIKTPATKSHGN
jgi:hypothetical protein